MHRIVASLPLVAAVSFLGCTPSPEPSTPQQDTSIEPAPEPTPVASAEPTSSAEPAPEPAPMAESGPIVASPSVAKANAEFSYALYQKVRTEPGNLVFSPASVQAALMMTYAGARGATQTEMAKTLQVDPASSTITPEFGKTLTSLNQRHQGLSVSVANRLFGEKSFTFERPYLEEVQRDFGAPLQPLDMRSDPEGARGTINGWVSEQTAGKIPELLGPRSISNGSRLVLVNAVYFLADWLAPFRKEATRDESFALGGGKQKTVPMMHNTAYVSYGEVQGVKLLKLGYMGGTTSMTIVLPSSPTGLGAVEATLSPKTVEGWDAAMKGQRVVITLPKFKLEPSSTSMRKALEAMGMKLSFDKDKADFTGIANPVSPADRLSISDVIHQAFVAVDEKGTEAAAATAVVMVTAGAMPSPEQPKEFKADHPFLFLIRDDSAKVVLFAGRVTEP